MKIYTTSLLTIKVIFLNCRFWYPVRRFFNFVLWQNAKVNEINDEFNKFLFKDLIIDASKSKKGGEANEIAVEITNEIRQIGIDARKYLKSTPTKN